MAKYSTELKIAACKDYLYNGLSNKEVCLKHGITYSSKNHNSILNIWVHLYLTHGESAFDRQNWKIGYSAAFKEKIVKEYLSCGDSLLYVATKHNLPATTLKQWVLMYNTNKELKDYNPNKEAYMSKPGRKTSFEERVEIVKYCIDHNRNYQEAADFYEVSYNQVYSWVKKYELNGEEGLFDKRGCHKSYDELDELERLRRENERFKKQLQEKDMLTELLKKVQEIERM